MKLGAVEKGSIVVVGFVQLEFEHGRERKRVGDVIHVRLSGASL